MFVFSAVMKKCFKIFKTPRYIERYKSMILGIETSCDDTGCAIVDESGNILGDCLHSQNLVHLRYGGINPILAQEFHREHIEQVVQSTLNKAAVTIEQLDGIAITVKPGLLASLDVGVKYAKYVARLNNKLLFPIHHMEAHSLLARMYHTIEFPFLVLLISGGHCLLALVNELEQFDLLGQCLDNSPGEAFDKVARRLKLKNITEYSQMSGGQAIEKAALKATNPERFVFPLPLATYRDCNFSFSGLKDTAFRTLKRKEKEHNIMGDEIIPEINDLCAAFQIAITRHLIHRTKRAAIFCELKNLLPKDRKSLVVSGGVACNNFIFESIKAMGYDLGYKVYRPPPKVCTDNGIMIAWNGMEKLTKGCGAVKNINFKDIKPKAPLGVNIINQVQEASLSVKVGKLKL